MTSHRFVRSSLLAARGRLPTLMTCSSVVPSPQYVVWSISQEGILQLTTPGVGPILSAMPFLTWASRVRLWHDSHYVTMWLRDKGFWYVVSSKT